MGPKVDDASGTCRLCGTYGPLRLSHVAPRAAFKRIMRGPDIEVPRHQPVKVTADASVFSNEQWTARLLCGACEQRFGIWENYAFQVLSQADGSFPWLAGTTPFRAPIANAPSVDANKLSLFASSLFWRLSASGRYSPLGPYESDFRRYLLVDGTPFPEHARLVVVLLDHSHVTIGRVDRSIVTSSGGRAKHCRFHRFTILGADMWLYVGGEIPRELDERCFARTSRVLIRPADAFARELGKLLLDSPPKGSLARA